MVLISRLVSRTWKGAQRFGTLSPKFSVIFAGRVGIFPQHLGFFGRSSTNLFEDPEGSNSPPTTSGLLHPQSRLTVASIVASGRLPDPALGIISELDAAIKVISKSNHGKERICEYILNEVLGILATNCSPLTNSLPGLHQIID